MATSKPLLGTIDASALKVNQALIVGLVLVGFVLGGALGTGLVALVAVSLAIGAAVPGTGPFQLLYRKALAPAGIVRPRPEPGEAAPHRFAQTLGAVFLAAAFVALLAGTEVVGWGLALLVVALALVNLVFGFCAGCFVFLHARRLWRTRAGSVA
jgi:hypothetical protein